jgi:20S proteasome alpha/beta subunit
MTTIAATRREMAADRRVSDESSRYSVCKIKRIGDALVGGCGSNAGVNKFFRWFEAGADIERIPKLGKEEDDIQILVLRVTGLFVYDASFIADELLDPFYAVGSGAQAALAAMHMGADIDDAIEIASKVDNATGDGIDVLRI